MVYHIPVSLLYRPWKTALLEICKAAIQKTCFELKVEVLPAHQSKRPAAGLLHGAVVGGGGDANVGAELLNVLCAQTLRFCYCMQTLLANVFLAFAAKVHFTCILSMLL